MSASSIVNEVLTELQALGKKAESWAKSTAIKIEHALAPLAKEIETTGLQLAEQAALQIGAQAAADFAAGKKPVEVLSGIEAQVKVALPAAATEEAQIALNGLVASIAAKAKQDNAANPVNGTNQ